jgi:MoaA/NifB/PqqE/SkfB family radical SAM enzyme
MNKIELASRLPLYYTERKIGLNSIMPINLTLALTNRCNSRCLTCRKYEMESSGELTAEEWSKIFSHLPMFWVTFTGGEPFLYKDITEVYWHLVNLSHPAIVNIPTNGLLEDRVVNKVWEMANMDKSVQLIVNVSLDHWMPYSNDQIRGVKGYFQKATNTLKLLQKLDCDNLTVGIHTVISKYNVKSIEIIAEKLSELLTNKSHYITEVAENRVELGTIGLDITPEASDYKKAIESLDKDKSLIQSMRNVYYKRVVGLLSGNKRYVPCFAGYMSGQITAEGNVWHCCIQGKSIGNLRDYDYDMRYVWNNHQSWLLRKENKECVCPMANAGYTNSLLHIPTMIKVAGNMVKEFV